MGKHLEHAGWTACRIAMLDEHGDCIRVYETRKAACQALGINPGTFTKYFKRLGEYPIKFEGQDCTLVEYNKAGHIVQVLYNTDEEPAVFQTYGAAIKWIGCAPSTFYSRIRKFLEGDIPFGQYDLANPITCKGNEMAGQPVFVTRTEAQY